MTTGITMAAYQGAIDSGVEAMKKWMADRAIKPDDLPENVWDLPRDCPLWDLNLSLSQAAAIVAAARKRKQDA